MLDSIGRAVDARPLAVPVSEDAIHGALRIALDLLRTEHGGGAELFINRGQEAYPVLLKDFLCLPQRLVDHTQRGAAIAADEACGVQSARGIERTLHQRQAHQRLGSRQKNLSVRCQQIVRQLIGRTKSCLFHHRLFLL